MKALRLKSSGVASGIEAFYLDEVPDPIPGPQDLLVRVKAFGLNRADLLQAMGLYPPPPAAPKDIAGLEYAGEVIARGAATLDFKAGERVFGIVPGGAFAEKLVVHEREAMRLPPNINFTEGAAFPEAFSTAFDAFVLQGGLRPNDTVLIHAVGSGVGTAAIQIASAFGAVSIGTARTAEKLERSRELGLTHGILCPDGPTFRDELLQKTGGRGADLALELVGGAYLAETIECMAHRGRILLVGLLGGEKGALKLHPILRKRLKILGTVLRSRPIEEKIQIAQSVQRELVPMLEAGKLKPVVDGVFAVASFRQAFERMEANKSFGKVVLQWPS